MQLKEIREYGVYVLPDGREVIAQGGGISGFFRLYDPLALKYEGPPMYETNERGVITSLGRPTPWSVGDLIEADARAGFDPRRDGASLERSGECDFKRTISGDRAETSTSETLCATHQRLRSLTKRVKLHVPDAISKVDGLATASRALDGEQRRNCV